MKYSFFILLFLSFSSWGQQKFELSAEFRPRMEQRLGYRTLAPTDAKTAFFISERFRLQSLYSTDQLKLFISLQDYRVWGNEEQVKNIGSIGLHEGWAELRLKPNNFLKLGRQEISYEDNRLLGNLDWVQQARSHDGVVYKYVSPKTNFHLGSFFNQSAEQVTGTVYKLNNYKSMSYAWYNQKLDSGRISLSYYAILDGLPNKDSIPKSFYRFTTGPNTSFKLDRITLNVGAYLQLGKTISNQSIKAFFTNIYAEYAHRKTFFGLGYDFLSGNNAKSSDQTEYKAFHTLYPTNHKYYGHMDYFLDIPSDTKQGGLQDIYARIQYKPNTKGLIGVDAHYFSLGNNVKSVVNPAQYLDPYLGVELDFFGSYKALDFMTINGGYSLMLASDSMKEIKGGDNKRYNGWSFISLTLKPTLFQHIK